MLQTRAMPHDDLERIYERLADLRGDVFGLIDDLSREVVTGGGDTDAARAIVLLQHIANQLGIVEGLAGDGLRAPLR